MGLGLKYHDRLYKKSIANSSFYLFIIYLGSCIHILVNIKSPILCKDWADYTSDMLGGPSHMHYFVDNDEDTTWKTKLMAPMWNQD